MRYVLFFALCIFSASSHAYNCNSFWAAGFPDPEIAGEAVACDEFLPMVATHPSAMVYYTNSIAITEDSKLRLNLLAEALDYAFGKYVALGDMPTVKAIFYHRPHFGDRNALASAMITHFTEGESCPIMIYPSSNSLSKEYFQQLIARELFHCYQKKNAKEQVAAVNNLYIGDWWFNGLAQMFSNIVYPSNDFEYSTVHFAPLNASGLLYEQESSYRLVHFFQSYFNNSGASARVLTNMMLRFPTTSGSSEAETAMRIPDVANKFHKYAEELTAENLKDSSGVTAPLTVIPTPIEVTNAVTQTISLEHSDFTVKPYRLIFPAGGKYTLSLTVSSPTKVTMRKVEETEFRPVLSEITTDCDQDRKYDIVMTSVNSIPSGYTATLTIERQDNEACECDVNKLPKDSCLVGAWVLDNSSLDSFMRRTLGSMPNSRYEGSSGVYAAEFLASGEVVFKVQDFKTNVSLNHGAGRGSMVQTTNGTAVSRYSTGNHKICAQPQNNGLASETVVTVGGRTMRQRSTPPFDMATRSFTYACEGDTLVYKEAKGVGPGGSDMTFDFVFKRLGL